MMDETLGYKKWNSLNLPYPWYSRWLRHSSEHLLWNLNLLLLHGPLWYERLIIYSLNPSHTLSVESTWQQTNQYINLEISIQGNKHMKWVGKRDNLIGYQELVYFKISLMVWILLLLQWEKGLGLESWEVLGYICMSAFVSMYLTIIIK